MWCRWRRKDKESPFSHLRTGSVRKFFENRDEKDIPYRMSFFVGFGPVEECFLYKREENRYT